MGALLPACPSDERGSQKPEPQGRMRAPNERGEQKRGHGVARREAGMRAPAPSETIRFIGAWHKEDVLAPLHQNQIAQHRGDEPQSASANPPSVDRKRPEHDQQAIPTDQKGVWRAQAGKSGFGWGELAGSSKGLRS